jgi:hypothetical protein
VLGRIIVIGMRHENGLLRHVNELLGASGEE